MKVQLREASAIAAVHELTNRRGDSCPEKPNLPAARPRAAQLPSKAGAGDLRFGSLAVLAHDRAISRAPPPVIMILYVHVTAAQPYSLPRPYNGVTLLTLTHPSPIAADL